MTTLTSSANNFQGSLPPTSQPCLVSSTFLNNFVSAEVRRVVVYLGLAPNQGLVSVGKGRGQDKYDNSTLFFVLNKAWLLPDTESLVYPLHGAER